MTQIGKERECQTGKIISPAILSRKRKISDTVEILDFKGRIFRIGIIKGTIPETIHSRILQHPEMLPIILGPMNKRHPSNVSSVKVPIMHQNIP